MWTKLPEKITYFIEFNIPTRDSLQFAYLDRSSWFQNRNPREKFPKNNLLFSSNLKKQLNNSQNCNNSVLNRIENVDSCFVMTFQLSNVRVNFRTFAK